MSNLILSVQDSNGIPHKVEYIFDRFRETNGLWVGYILDGNYNSGETRLTVNVGELPNKNWAVFYFMYSSYWLVAPLITNEYLKMTKGIWAYNIHHFNRNKNCNCCIFEATDKLLKLMSARAS